MKWCVASLLIALCACVETGQERVSLPLYLAGSGMTSPLTAAGGIAVDVERAELAFGPLYLCAGNTAGELCETARMEWLESSVVDLTSAAPVESGQLSGISGPVRSFMYDLGISSQLTRDEPYVLPAAQALGGASLRVSGSAQLGGGTVAFEAQLAVQQTEGTEPGVPVVRKSTSDMFVHEVTATERGLLVRFDGAAWLRTMDLRSYLEDASCSEGGAPIVCAQSIEQTCAADGGMASSRDCAALGQACLAGVGCTGELQIEDGSEPYRALRNALLVGKRPTFEWGFEP